MRKNITIGNPEGAGEKYSVEIGSSSYAGSQMFIVNDVFSEQEALDAAVDYCEEHGWNGLFCDNEEEAQEYPDDYITAGNHGHLLPSDQVIVHSLNESKKQTIKLNESQLRKIIAKSVKKVLNEANNQRLNESDNDTDSEIYQAITSFLEEIHRIITTDRESLEYYGEEIRDTQQSALRLRDALIHPRQRRRGVSQGDLTFDDVS